MNTKFGFLETGAADRANGAAADTCPNWRRLRLNGARVDITSEDECSGLQAKKADDHGNQVQYERHGHHPSLARRRTVHRVDTDQATDDGERDVNPVEGSQTRDEPNHESDDGQDSPHQ